MSNLYLNQYGSGILDFPCILPALSNGSISAFNAYGVSPVASVGRSKYNLTEITGTFGPGQSGTAKPPACYEWFAVLGTTGGCYDANGVPQARTYAQFATAAASIPSQFFVGPKDIALYSVAQSAAKITRINKICGN
jgi:hypothetical protein